MRDIHNDDGKDGYGKGWDAIITRSRPQTGTREAVEGQDDVLYARLIPSVGRTCVPLDAAPDEALQTIEMIDSGALGRFCHLTSSEKM